MESPERTGWSRSQRKFIVYGFITTAIILFFIYISKLSVGFASGSEARFYTIILFVIITLIASLGGEMYLRHKGDRCDINVIDPWVAIHFFAFCVIGLVVFHVLLDYLYCSFSVSVTITFAFAFICSLISEGFEILTSKRWYRFSCESKKNRIVDVVVNQMGTIFAILIVSILYPV